VRPGALGGFACGVGDGRGCVGGRSFCDISDAGSVRPLWGFLAELVFELGEDILISSIGFGFGRGWFGFCGFLDGLVAADALEQIAKLVVGGGRLCSFASHCCKTRDL
jgi:hypothetical protein